jgi:uncharacterized protein (DUF1330 family)
MSDGTSTGTTESCGSAAVSFGKCDGSVWMGAYLINYMRMRDGVPNQEGLAHVKRTVEAYGGRWHGEQGLARAEENSQVLVEFGTMTEAQNWYNSCEYKNISQLYVDNAIDLVLVDGVFPDFTMAGFA